METLKHTPECVIGGADFSPRSAVRHRLQVLQHEEARCGMGPADLVWLNKQSAAGTFSGASKASSFHHVLGLDVCSTASCSAYGRVLSQASEEVRLIC